jgi:hypothetical protein
MRLRFLTLIVALAVLAGCDTSGSVNGGGSENGSHGRVQIGVPF